MSKKGTATFIAQRATAVLLLPLAIWLLYSVAVHAGGDFAAARAWASELKNTLLLGGFIVIGAWHMKIGMGEIIDDYLHGGMRPTAIALNWAFALGVIALAGWSLYTLLA